MPTIGKYMNKWITVKDFELDEKCQKAAKDICEMNMKLLKFFDHDYDKAIAWLQTKNPGLGGISPLEMIGRGRLEKLINFVESPLEENYP